PLAGPSRDTPSPGRSDRMPREARAPPPAAAPSPCRLRRPYTMNRNGSLPLALAGGCAEAATSPHALPESFPLLRRHVLHALFNALGDATTDTRAREAAASKSAEEDSTQRQKRKRLPEGNLPPAEKRRHHPVP